MGAQDRARDAYAALCVLYGDDNARYLMKVRGACNPIVARLAKKLGKSRAAARAALAYRELSSLGIGYWRLMTAGKNDGSIRSIVNSVRPANRNFNALEVDAAVRVILAMIDNKRGVV